MHTYPRCLKALMEAELCSPTIGNSSHKNPEKLGTVNTDSKYESTCTLKQDFKEPISNTSPGKAKPRREITLPLADIQPYGYNKNKLINLKRKKKKGIQQEYRV